MKQARVLNGVIVEIVTPRDGFALEDLYHPDFIANLTIVPETADIGWQQTPNGWIAPLDAGSSKTDLNAYAADRRWERETGGILVSGQEIATDRSAQAMITGAFSLITARPQTTIRFKAKGGFIELTAAQMSAIAITVAEHVQTCFAIEAEVAAQIESGAITTTAEIDAAFAS